MPFIKQRLKTYQEGIIANDNNQTFVLVKEELTSIHFMSQLHKTINQRVSVALFWHTQDHQEGGVDGFINDISFSNMTNSNENSNNLISSNTISTNFMISSNQVSSNEISFQDSLRFQSETNISNFSIQNNDSEDSKSDETKSDQSSNHSSLISALSDIEEGNVKSESLVVMHHSVNHSLNLPSEQHVIEIMSRSDSNQSLVVSDDSDMSQW